jgi:preprotein translocase subunit SecG
MSYFVAILVFLLFVNAGFLILLILAQPPKKDAGGALAFGGGAADALFGAGSGNALTKVTKWATVAFIALAVILGTLETHLSRGNQSEFESGVEQQQQMQAAPRINPAPTTPPSGSSPAVTPAMPVYPATNAAPAATPNGK